MQTLLVQDNSANICKTKIFFKSLGLQTKKIKITE